MHLIVAELASQVQQHVHVVADQALGLRPANELEEGPSPDGAAASAGRCASRS